ncbi:hypothetical protein H7347_01935 [Corynebacterium sp. zg-331]|uniref:hypothetical protein n=1 Tax=unclassified Corynebacterium TaxID=2624378 RepID=UPI00128B09D1|nr:MULTISPECIES: hypothetical protein [unclassified Corynebacterium]MBC3185347.1 hypothetical protein [Corynebacterium sp. zg-331]MPV51844.1 hypothetical protein [Corynebacterium sp. zg331]
MMILVGDNIAEDLPIEVPPGYDALSFCSQGLSGTVALPNGERRNVMVSAAHCLHGVEGEDDIAYLVCP